MQRSRASRHTLFLYGTLMDEDVLGLVLGRDVETDAQPAALAGWRVAAISGRDFPGLWPSAGGVAQGLALDVTRQEILRLNRYEGSHYHLREVTIDLPASGHGVVAKTYMAKPWVRPGGPWTLEYWQHRHKAAYMRRWFE